MASKVEGFGGILKFLKGRFGVTTIGVKRLFTGNVILPDYLNVEEVEQIDNPFFPGEKSGSRSRRFFNTSLCLAGEVRTSQDVIIQDRANPKNLAFQFGIKNEDAANFEDDLTDLLSGFMGACIADVPGNQLNNFSFLSVGSAGELGGGSYIQAFRTTDLEGDADGDESAVLVSSPEGNVQIELDGISSLAQLNGNDLYSVISGGLSGSKYWAWVNAAGSVDRIDYFLKSDPGVSGLRAISLPFALPQVDEANFILGSCGIANSPAFVLANYEAGSLTANSFQIETFDGFGSSPLPIYILASWVRN